MTKKFTLKDAENLQEALGLSIGASSMCWENVSGAGVYQPHEAIEILQELEKWILSRYSEKPTSTIPGGFLPNPNLRVYGNRFESDENDEVFK